jgi:hypothetical protein
MPVPRFAQALPEAGRCAGEDPSLSATLAAHSRLNSLEPRLLGEPVAPNRSLAIR